MPTRARYRLISVLLVLFSLLLFVNARPLIDSNDAPIAKRYNVSDPSLPPAVRTVCSGGMNATTITNATMLPGGVSMITGKCAPPTIGSSGNDSDPADRLAVEHPSCPTALNDCVNRFGSQFQGNGWVSKCGAPCSSSCYQGLGGPNPNDCQHIANSLYSQNPQLFVLNPNNFVLLSYQSCGTGIQNQIAASSIGCPQTMIYDYTDWGAVAQYLAWSCQAAQYARGGRCTGNTGLYQPGTNDFYIQVYTN